MSKKIPRPSGDKLGLNLSGQPRRKGRGPNKAATNERLAALGRKRIRALRRAVQRAGILHGQSHAEAVAWVAEALDTTTTSVRRWYRGEQAPWKHGMPGKIDALNRDLLQQMLREAPRRSDMPPAQIPQALAPPTPPTNVRVRFGHWGLVGGCVAAVAAAALAWLVRAGIL